MNTQIFKNWFDFNNREDRDINGVSEEFAKDHPEFEKENETNKGCWNCSDCSGLRFEKDLKEERDEPGIGKVPIVAPTRFIEGNDKAMADMVECARLEKEQSEKQ